MSANQVQASPITTSGIPGLSPTPAQPAPAGGSGTTVATPNASVATTFDSTPVPASTPDVAAQMAQAAAQSTQAQGGGLNAAQLTGVANQMTGMVNSGQMATSNTTSLTDITSSLGDGNLSKAFTSMLQYAGDALQGARGRLSSLLAEHKANGTEPNQAEIVEIQEQISNASMIFELLRSMDREEDEALQAWLR